MKKVSKIRTNDSSIDNQPQYCICKYVETFTDKYPWIIQLVFQHIKTDIKGNNCDKKIDFYSCHVSQFPISKKNINMLFFIYSLILKAFSITKTYESQKSRKPKILQTKNPPNGKNLVYQTKNCF